MQVPPTPLVGRADRNGAPTLHINDPSIERMLFASTSLSDPSALFSLSLAPDVGGPSDDGSRPAVGNDVTKEDDQNVRTLFCMMIQMQNIIKDIQRNVGNLESRVTSLEAEGLSRIRINSSPEQNEAKSNPAMGNPSPTENGSPYETGNFDAVGEMDEASSRHPQRQTRSKPSPTDSADPSSHDHVGEGVCLIESPTERSIEEDAINRIHAVDKRHAPLVFELFSPRDETSIKTNLHSQESPIPFISRRTLWKKANKPKWKRRADLVPRLKEIVNEKFRTNEDQDGNADVIRSSKPGDFDDLTAFNGETKPQNSHSGAHSTVVGESRPSIIPPDVYANRTVFPNLQAPVCLAPIWRSADVASEPSFPKTISTSEGVGAVFVKREGASDDRPPISEPSLSEPSSKPEFMCAICFKVLGSKSSLDTHTRSIHENRKFPCNDCGKRFFDRSTLRRHKKCIHENITHRCKFCSLEFSRRHYLTSHVHKEHPGKAEAESSGTKAKVTAGGAILPIGFYNEVDTQNGAQSQRKDL